MLLSVVPHTMSAHDFALKMLLFIEFNIVPGSDPTTVLEGQGTQGTSSLPQ